MLNNINNQRLMSHDHHEFYDLSKSTQVDPRWIPNLHFTTSSPRHFLAIRASALISRGSDATWPIDSWSRTLSINSSATSPRWWPAGRLKKKNEQFLIHVIYDLCWFMLMFIDLYWFIIIDFIYLSRFRLLNLMNLNEFWGVYNILNHSHMGWAWNLVQTKWFMTR